MFFRDAIFIVLFFFTLGEKTCVGLERHERLLLNDPQVLQSQITNLMQRVDDLHTEMNQEIGALKAQLASKDQEISVFSQQLNSQGRSA
jgi:hypothetical protein